MILSDLLSYPKSRDAIASKKGDLVCSIFRYIKYENKILKNVDENCLNSGF